MIVVHFGYQSNRKKTPPAVARLEASLVSGKHSPSIASLRKYAKAVGKQLDIRLV